MIVQKKKLKKCKGDCDQLYDRWGQLCSRKKWGKKRCTCDQAAAGVGFAVNGIVILNSSPTLTLMSLPAPKRSRLIFGATENENAMVQSSTQT